MALPLTRRGILLLGLATLTMAGEAEARGASLSITEARGRTRVSLPLAANATWELSSRTAPSRLLLHLPDGGWSGPSRQAGKGLVRMARWLARQKLLVLDLARPVTKPVADLARGQLTIEFAAGNAEAFAAFSGEQRSLVASRAVPPARRLPLVVIDPGHGGKDPGTIGRSGTYEKRITLAAGLELKRQLEASRCCRVAMTRSRDVFIPLEGRVEFARRNDAALFISLHADSAPGARGASVYTLNERASDALSAGLAARENDADRKGGLRLPPTSPEVQRILISLVKQETRQGSARLAGLAVTSLGKSVRLLPHTHREAAFAVLKSPAIPSMLVEMGFLSHPDDESALKQPAHRAKICAALTKAVEDWVARREAGLPSAGG